MPLQCYTGVRIGLAWEVYVVHLQTLERSGGGSGRAPSWGSREVLDPYCPVISTENRQNECSQEVQDGKADRRPHLQLNYLHPCFPGSAGDAAKVQWETVVGALEGPTEFGSQTKCLRLWSLSRKSGPLVWSQSPSGPPRHSLQWLPIPGEAQSHGLAKSKTRPLLLQLTPTQGRETHFEFLYLCCDPLPLKLWWHGDSDKWASATAGLLWRP